MREFKICIRSVQDVLKFVSLATAQPYQIQVGDDRHQVNGKSFMEMFCLNFRKPLTVTVSCSEEEFRQLLAGADRFLVK